MLSLNIEHVMLRLAAGIYFQDMEIKSNNSNCTIDTALPIKHIHFLQISIQYSQLIELSLGNTTQREHTVLFYNTHKPTAKVFDDLMLLFYCLL